MTALDPFIALIPAYNEAATVGAIVAQIRQRWRCPVVVIDDCSTDDTARIAHAAGAVVLPLTIQLGAWGAIQTGLRYALQQGYRTAVTLDADGQHEPDCIGALLEPLADGQTDVSIGAFPERASRARRFAWRYFRWLTGLELEDITSGFRAYNHAAMIVLASREASLLDYQDVGVLLILRRKGLQIVEVSAPMQPRATGPSKIFRSWLIVGKYMLQTTLLCIARVGYNHLRPDDDD
ncbi:MAG TPA: glycosyltransferase family 2 protein [Candidatus Competibacteraceae bacterium]|nr:glycosyltransferase family 2 protein [Candidatus Competibacteraceae bacterium]HRZ05688.1 glycosyltransferase family 2 protein [Candidatus Competibacteraceae bacterium]HSA46253.1 glycosyltransferase family 2 protein [Candidatus Competibacteraceae bacterium]